MISTCFSLLSAAAATAAVTLADPTPPTAALRFGNPLPSIAVEDDWTGSTWDDDFDDY